MRQRTPREQCITCGHGVLGHYRDAEAEGEAFTLVRCASCGTVFVRDPFTPQPAALAEALPPADPAVVAADTRRPGHHYLIEALTAHIASANPSTAAPLRMLEVGAGRGDLALMLQERFGERVSYTGIEPTAEYASAAVARGLAVRVETLEAFAAGPHHPLPFDLVVLDNVLEHLLDPAGALRTLEGMLAPAGALVAVVPNLHDVRRYYPSLYRRRYLWIPQEHINYFTWRSLRAIMAANGLRARHLHPPLRGPWRRRLTWGAKHLAERLAGLSPRGLYAIALRPE